MLEATSYSNKGRQRVVTTIPEEADGAAWGFRLGSLEDKPDAFIVN